MGKIDWDKLVPPDRGPFEVFNVFTGESLSSSFRLFTEACREVDRISIGGTGNIGSPAIEVRRCVSGTGT